MNYLTHLLVRRWRVHKNCRYDSLSVDLLGEDLVLLNVSDVRTLKIASIISIYYNRYELKSFKMSLLEYF